MMATSPSISTGGFFSVFFAVLGGMIIGGVVGASVTANIYHNKQEKKKEKELNGKGGSGLRKSRGIDGSDDVVGDAVAQLTRNVTNFDDVTHINFLSDIIARLWPYISEAGSATIRETVEPMFADMMPSPMKALKFTKIDLGHVPIHFDNIIVHELQSNGCVKFDWDILWKSSSDIQLDAGYGIKFGVKSIHLEGRMSFLLQPLSNELPCVDAVQYSFVNPPLLELDFTGLANLADFTVIDKTIRKIIEDVLASMVVLPLRMVYKMTPTINLWDIMNKPMAGVARVTLISGRGFQVEKRTLRSDDVPDVYCVMKLGAGNGYGPDMWKSRTIKNDCNPEWTTTSGSSAESSSQKSKKKSSSKKDKNTVITKACKEFLLADLDQILTIEAWDEDAGPADPDDYLGSCQVVVGQILLAGKSMELELMEKEKKGNVRGTGSYITIAVDVLPFTTDDHSSLTKKKQQVEEEVKEEDRINPEDQLAGLLTVMVTKAFDIPLAKKDAATFVKILYGDKEIGVTGVVTDLPGYDAINPEFELPIHFPLKPVGTKEHPKLENVKLQLMNTTKEKPILLGELVIESDSILRADQATIQDKRKIGKGGASLEFYVSLAGVENIMDGMAEETATALANTTAVRALGDEDADGDVLVSLPNKTATGAPISREGATKRMNSNITRTSLTSGERILVGIVKGYGFQVRKMGRFKKDDVPDVYCVVKFGSSPQTWRTTTFKNSIEPSWNETSEYSMSSPNQVIIIDVYDENRRTKDDFYGNARVAVGKVLLNGGAMDVEVMLEGQKTGLFITVSCKKLH